MQSMRCLKESFSQKTFSQKKNELKYYFLRVKFASQCNFRFYIVMMFLVWYTIWDNWIVVKNDENGDDTEEIVYSDDSENDEYVESDDEGDEDQSSSVCTLEQSYCAYTRNSTERYRNKSKSINGGSSSIPPIYVISWIDDPFGSIKSTQDINIVNIDGANTHSNCEDIKSPSNSSHSKLLNIAMIPLKLILLFIFILIACFPYKLITSVNHLNICECLSLGFGYGFELWNCR